jgi:hypothetical protein
VCQSIGKNSPDVFTIGYYDYIPHGYSIKNLNFATLNYLISRSAAAPTGQKRHYIDDVQVCFPSLPPVRQWVNLPKSYGRKEKRLTHVFSYSVNIMTLTER